MKKTLVIPEIGEKLHTNGDQVLIYTRHERSDYTDSLEVKRIGEVAKGLTFATIQGANKWLEEEGFNFEIDLDGEFEKRINKLENEIKSKEKQLESLKWERYFYNKNKEAQ